MKNRLLILIAAFGILFQNSCSKFLEPKSENEFVPTNVSSLDEMLLYEVYYKQSRAICGYINLMSDDIATIPVGNTTGIFSPFSAAAVKAIYSWQPNIYNQLIAERVYESEYDLYSQPYEKILGCNAALDYLHTVEGTQAQKDRVEAQARALRAFYYFHLVNCFGQPYNHDKSSMGVPLKLSSAVSDAQIARNSVEEVYEQVLKDLLRAEELFAGLPAEEQWKADTRVSLPFTQLMLSRVYLYMEEWQKASDMAQLVLDNETFRLLDWSELPWPEVGNPVNTYFNFHSYENPETIWVYGLVADVTNFAGTLTFNSSNQIIAFVIASDELLNALGDDGLADVRKYQYIVQDYNSVNKKGYGKIAVDANYFPIQENNFGRSLRLPEAYLNKAEAEAMLWKEGAAASHGDTAWDLIQELREKRCRWLDLHPDTRPTSADELVEFVREERRREFCMEEHRWFDLRRYGMPEIRHRWTDSDGTVTTYTLKEHDPQYTLPIPPEVIEQNPALVQNPLGPIREN